MLLFIYNISNKLIKKYDHCGSRWYYDYHWRLITQILLNQAVRPSAATVPEGSNASLTSSVSSSAFHCETRHIMGKLWGKAAAFLDMFEKKLASVNNLNSDSLKMTPRCLKAETIHKNDGDVRSLKVFATSHLLIRCISCSCFFLILIYACRWYWLVSWTRSDCQGSFYMFLLHGDISRPWCSGRGIAG